MHNKIREIRNSMRANYMLWFFLVVVISGCTLKTPVQSEHEAQPNHCFDVELFTTKFYKSPVLLAGESGGHPAIWNDNTESVLDTNHLGRIRSVIINEDEVIMGGESQNGDSLMYPCIWRNGDKVFLDTMPGFVSELFIHKGKLYSAGERSMTEVPDFMSYVGMYWVDTVPYMLEGDWVRYINGLYIDDDGKVYVCGGAYKYPDGAPKAALWINRKITWIDLTSYVSVASGITGENGEIYTSVSGTPLPPESSRIWYYHQDSTVTLNPTLPSDSLTMRSIISSDICIASNDVYVLGSYSFYNSEITISSYWKNDECIVFDSTGDAGTILHTASIQVTGDDVYIGGYLQNGEEYSPCYWENGNRVTFNSTEEIAVYDMVVIE